MVNRLQALFRTGYRRARISLNYARYRWHRYRKQEDLQGHDERIFAAFDYSPAIIDFAHEMSQGNLLLKCPVDAQSTVFDVGGFNGEWARGIRQRYGARVHVFEPNPRSVANLSEKFANDTMVHCHPFGLSGKSETAALALFGMGSSTFDTSPGHKRSAKSIDIQLRDVAEVVEEMGISRIDLLKINIEGGEYELLERMLDTGLHARCKCIRVQFHEWIEDSHRMRRQIRRRLAETHAIEWDYPFVWESWRRKQACAIPAARAA